MDALVYLFERENGDLAVTLTSEGAAYLEENPDEHHEDLLDTLLEDATCNGWDLLTADLIGCLSEAPVLTRGLVCDGYDAYTYMVVGDWWYFEPYQVRSVVDDLLRHGVAIFTKGA